MDQIRLTKRIIHKLWELTDTEVMPDDYDIRVEPLFLSGTFIGLAVNGVLWIRQDGTTASI